MYYHQVNKYHLRLLKQKYFLIFHDQEDQGTNRTGTYVVKIRLHSDVPVTSDWR